jgi:DNA-directed RNA polymerase subunit RPC12/RpoP
MNRNVWLGGAALVIAIGAAVMYLMRDPGVAAPTRLAISGVCLACQKEAYVEFDATRDTVPLVCPSCGQRAVYNWFYCEQCDKRFVPAPALGSDGIARPPMIPSCPGCGGMSCRSWDPGLAEELGRESKGDMPFPTWPPK